MNASEAWAVFITVLSAWSFWRIGVLEGRLSQMRQNLTQAIGELNKAVDHIEKAAQCRLLENNSNT